MTGWLQEEPAVLRARKFLPIALLIAIPPFTSALAQDFEPDSKVNTNIGFPLTVPVGSTSDFTHIGTGVTLGGGYNFDHHNAFLGEFLWTWLYPTEESLDPLRPFTATGNLNGHSNLFVVTGNYRYELRGQRFGTYFIGGIGYYYRNASRTEGVAPAAGTPCTSTWQWWGFRCSGTTVETPVTTSTFPTGGIGGNAGIGITIRTSEDPRYRAYIEARYHYAPGTFTLRLIPITVGVRF